MSLIFVGECVIEPCQFHEHPVLTDKSTMRNHILNHHSYQEKREAATRLGIYENNPYRLAEILTEFSIGEKIE